MFLKALRGPLDRFVNAERTGRDGVFIGISNFAVASVVSEVTGETQRRGGTQRKPHSSSSLRSLRLCVSALKKRFVNTGTLIKHVTASGDYRGTRSASAPSDP